MNTHSPVYFMCDCGKVFDNPIVFNMHYAACRKLHDGKAEKAVDEAWEKNGERR